MIDIPTEHLATVKRIIAEAIPESEVSVFGSRAGLSAKPHSDLDLLIRGAGPIPSRTMRRLVVAFQESDLPFRVDLLDWHASGGPVRDRAAAGAVRIWP